MITLRDYQERIAKQAVDILHQRGLVYLTMQVRTGKTLTALSAAQRYGVKRVLFVTKKKAISSIQSDYAAGGFSFALQVINYESVHTIENEPDLLIVDEAHCLGAFPKPAMRTKTMRDMFSHLPMIFLSGTPTPESYSQIYHQLWISDKSPFAEYKKFYRWADSFVDKEKMFMNGFQLTDYSHARERLIKPIIDPIMISFSQEQAGFSCTVNENIVHVVDPMIPEKIKEIFKHRVMTCGSSQVIADSPAKLMSKMHQLSSGTVIAEDGTAHILSTKKARVIREKFAGQRIAIFYKFVAELDVLQREFGDQLTQSPEEFQQDASKIFVSQILSGREGIALHCADALVFYSIDYSATSYWQGRARLQTLNRKTPANIYWMFTDGGIEQRVYDAVSNKKDFTLSYFMQKGGVASL